MAKNYSINIINGTGTANVLNDTYSATITVPGYDSSTLTPKSVTVAEGTDSYTFTVAATGTLTFHVTEDGTSSGIPVEGATFYRTDSLGNTYGTPVVSDNTGYATLTNLPFTQTGGTKVYYKQTASKYNYEFDGSVKEIILTSANTTVEVKNTLAAERTFNLYDANYGNLVVDTATLTLS